MKAGGPDIKQLRQRDLPQGRFPGDASVDFRVYIDPKAHEQVHNHANENTGVEICGVLVGRWGKDDKGPFLTCSASIRGEAATNKFAEVTFTHDTWSKINATMDKEYAGYVIVGWYHTHPDFGIFLSDRDRFIHEHFFSEPGQVALVVDPVRKQEGIFTWSNGRASPASYYWVGEKLTISRASDDGEMREEKRKGGASTSSSKESSASSERRDYALAPMGGWTLALGGLCIFLLGYMLSNYLLMSDRQRLIESLGAVEFIGRYQMGRDLERASQITQATAILLNDIARKVASSDTERDMLTKQAREVLSLGRDLDQMRRRYGVTDSEVTELANIIAQFQKKEAAATQAASAQSVSIPPAATSSPADVPTAAPTTRTAP